MQSEDVFCLIDRSMGWLIDWLTDCLPLGCLVQHRKVTAVGLKEQAVGLKEQAVVKMESSRTTDMMEHTQEDKILDMLSLWKM